MSSINNNFYWVGEQPVSELAEDMVLVNHIDEVATGLGGMVCIAYQDPHQIDTALKAFYQEKGRWSWAVYVSVETPYSRCH